MLCGLAIGEQKKELMLKKPTVILVIFLSISIFVSCVPKSQYDVLLKENERLKSQNEELLNGEDRSIAIIDNAYKDKDYKLAKESIEKIKQFHPESKSIPRFEKMLVQITKEEEQLQLQKDAEEKDRIRKENYNNTGYWYVLSDYYIEYKNLLQGNFSNSATENSRMNAKIVINKDRTISFKIFEYESNNPVKATSESPERYFIFYIFEENSENKYGSASGVNKSDNILVPKEDSAQLIKLLKENKKIEFRISGTKYNENTKYNFTLDNVEWFENALRILDEK